MTLKLNHETIQSFGQQAVGMQLLLSGSIDSPVEYLDFSLPDTFSFFCFQFEGLTFSTDELLGAALSNDGGVTFINDNENWDSYQASNLTFGANVGPVYTETYLAYDAMIDLTWWHQLTYNLPVSATMTLWPGSDTMLPAVRFSSTFGHDTTEGGSPIQFLCGGYSVNPSSAHFNGFARANFIRVVPYGNGDVNPPTSGDTIDGGSYFLWGYPV